MSQSYTIINIYIECMTMRGDWFWYLYFKYHTKYTHTSTTLFNSLMRQQIRCHIWFEGESEKGTYVQSGSWKEFEKSVVILKGIKS